MSRAFYLRISTALLFLVFIAAFCCVDGFYCEPNFPHIVRQDVRIDGLPKSLDGLKIVHMSDLHMVKFGKREERALRLIDWIKPDIICLTGDYVMDDGITPGDYTWRECMPAVTKFVSRLHAKHGVYACLGNWDSLEMPPMLEKAGAHMVDEKSITLDIRASRLTLAGMNGLKSPNFPPNPKNPVIVLEHVPLSADDLGRWNKRCDLVLAGHWHGGQVGWPFRMNDVEYLAGLFRVGRTQLYVTRGLGMHTHAVRFNCPSEVTLLTLRRR